MNHKCTFQLLDGMLICPTCGQIKTPPRKPPPPPPVRPPPPNPPRPRMEPIPQVKRVYEGYPRSTITISTEEKREWEKIKRTGRFSWNGIMHLVRLEYLKIEALKEELKEAQKILWKMALKQASPFIITHVGNNQPIERIKPSPQLHLNSGMKIEYLKELKEKFIESEDVMSLLTPIPPQELAEVPSRQVHQAIIEGRYEPD